MPLDYQHPTTLSPKFPVLMLILSSTGILMLLLSIVWCVTTWHTPGHFIFLPGGDTALGFRSLGGWLAWTEYASWMSDPDSIQWEIPWAAVMVVDILLIALPPYMRWRHTQR